MQDDRLPRSPEELSRAFEEAARGLLVDLDVDINDPHVAAALKKRATELEVAANAADFDDVMRLDDEGKL